MVRARVSQIFCLFALWLTSFLCRIGEKFREWVDEPLSPEVILECVTLYWLTETFPRSIYTYREVGDSPVIQVEGICLMNPRTSLLRRSQQVMIRGGISRSLSGTRTSLWSWHPFLVPGWKLVVTWYTGDNMRRYVMSNLKKQGTYHLTGYQGGHFAALEEPEAFKSDLVKFVDQVWPDISATL